MTVRFVVPGSDAIPLRQDTCVWARHGLVGGSRARACGRYVRGGDVFAWSIRHGSGANPVIDVDAFAGADHAFVDLAAGSDHTSQQVANAIAAALDAEFGHDDVTVDSVTVDGQTRYRVVIPAASAGAVGSAAATAGVRDQCGIHDFSRRDGTGPIAGTGWTHCTVTARDRNGAAVPAGTRCRIVAVGYAGIDSFRPRLAVGLGPAHSLTPGAITGIVDAGRPATGATVGYEIAALHLPTAIPCVIGDHAWIGVCDTGVASGTAPYRLHASAGFHGDLGAAENLLIEVTRADPTVAFPASLTPTISGNFAIHSYVCIFVECDDPAFDDGRGFAGNGSLWIEHGCRRDAAGETPTEDEPAGECFHYRFLTPPISRIALVAPAYALAAVDAAEDMSAVVYSWPDLANPPGSAVTRLGATGLLGWDDGTPDTYNVTTLGTRISLGDDVDANPYRSVGYNGGRIVGGTPTVLQIQFDTMAATFGVDGERAYDQGQSPDLRVSDYVVGGLRDLSEFVSFATSTMPYDAPAGVWPATYDLAGLDQRLGNLGREYHVLAELSPTADVVTVETEADAASSSGLLTMLASSPLASADLVLALASGTAAAAGTATTVAISNTSQRLGPVPAAGHGRLAADGGLRATAATTVQIWDGVPDAVGATLLDTLAVGTETVPLAPWGYYSTGGRALYLRSTEAIAVSGRALTVEI